MLRLGFLACGLGLLSAVEARPADGPLPPGCVRRIGTSAMRMPADFLDVAWSIDSRMLAFRHLSGALTLLDASSGEVVRRFPGPEWREPFFLLAGGKAALRDGRAIQIVDVLSGRKGQRINFDLGVPESVQFGPNGTTFLHLDEDGQAGEFRDWTRPTWRARFKRPASNAGWCRDPVFSADGKFVVFATTEHQCARVEVETGTIRTYALPAASERLLLHPDGKQIYLANSQVLLRVDLATGKELARRNGRYPSQPNLVLAPDGNELFLAPTESGEPIRVLNGRTLREERAIPLHRSGWCSLLCLSPDGKGLAYNDGTWCRLIDPATGVDRFPNQAAGHHSPVRHLALDRAGGKLLSADDQGEVRVTDPLTGKEWGAFCPTEVLLSGDRQCFPEISPDGTVVVVEGYGEKRFLGWDTASQRRIPLPVWSSRARILGFSRAARLWVATGENKVEEVDLKAGSSAQTLTLMSLPARNSGHSRLSADASTMVWIAPRGQTISVWRPTASDRPTIIPLNDRWDFSAFDETTGPFRRILALSADGQFCAFSRHERLAVEILDLKSNSRHSPPLPGEMPGPGELKLMLESLAFAPDGKPLALGLSDGTVCFWESSSAKQRFRAHLRNGGVTSVLFTPDGKHLIAGGYDTTVTVWDMATLQAMMDKTTP